MKKVKVWVNAATSNRVIAVLLLLMQAVAQGIAAGPLQQSWRYVVAGGCVAGIAGLVVRKNWGNWMGAVAMAGLCLMRVVQLTQKGFSLNGTLMALMFAFFAWALVKLPDSGIFDDWADAAEPKEPKEPKEKPLISLVQLRDQPRYLEAAVLANALSVAWGLNLSVAEEVPDDADGFVVGEDRFYVAAVTKAPARWFMVHNHDGPYFDEPEVVARTVPNLRFAAVIRGHSAWLSVDLMRTDSKDSDQTESYRMIGKAISALSDDGTLALICPQHSYFNLWSPELEEELCGEAPLEVFQKEVKAPVIGVENGEAIENAVAEARRRWPEFVAAFAARQPDDDRFIVKAPFTSETGETEHMWISVFGLEPEYVHGHLMNEPFHCKKLQQGSQVEVSVSEVSDWLCPDADDNPIGNFTHKAIKAAARAKTEAPEPS